MYICICYYNELIIWFTIPGFNTLHRSLGSRPCRIHFDEQRYPGIGLIASARNRGEALAGHDAEVLFSFADSQTGGQASGIGGLLSGNWTDDDRSKMDTLPLSSGRYEHLDLPAWWPCRVHKIRDDVAVVKFQISPPPNASSDEISRCAQLSSVTDIVSLNTLRYPCTDRPPITPSMFHRYCIDIPKELSGFASDVSVHSDFLKHCGGPTSVFFDSESSVLIVLSTDEDTIRNVSLLEETHLKMLRQKWAITRSLRQTMRSLEVCYFYASF
ncbi:hypothetical protein AHF37_05533 [Paragonimus kellicotti]|nr:hypothetical protein AHF37_05533 [Paragonimus kellicotti]